MRRVHLIAMAVLSCLMATLVAAPVLVGQEPAADPLIAQRDAWSDYYAAQLPRYRFTLASMPDEPLGRPELAMRWSNPLRPGTHGDLFVWSQNGRGVLLGSLFSYPSGNERSVAHEFQSLSQETIRCEHEGGHDFRIMGPGLDFEPIPDAPPPARSRAFRLTQMRKLLRDFQALGATDEAEQPLRALSQPIHRFQGEQVEDDGAIFAFVMGTDPELLLVISALPSDNGVQWHYAAGCFAAHPLKLAHKGTTIWKHNDSERQQGYASRHGIDRQPNELNVDPSTD